MTLLILGGTLEARRLAEALGDRAVLSLAGSTKAPVLTPHRCGGFGGAEGLAQYMQRENITALIDATHPFAAGISHNAVRAAARTGLPLLRLSRPAWPLDPAWQMVDNLVLAAEALPTGARVLLTVGSRSLQPFIPRADVWFLTRSIEPAAQNPPQGLSLLQRPPFSLADEISLMQDHKISHLVSKNSGGRATGAKLEAAKALNIRVIMVNRPQLPAALEVATVAQALNWVESQKGNP